MRCQFILNIGRKLHSHPNLGVTGYDSGFLINAINKMQMIRSREFQFGDVAYKECYNNEPQTVLDIFNILVCI